MLIKTVMRTAAALGLLAASGAASAVTITLEDDVGPVSGIWEFTISGSPDTWQMDFSIENTSDPALTTRLTSIGFDLFAGAEITGAVTPTGWDWYEPGSGPGTPSLPGVDVDVCFYTGSNCPSGNLGLLSTDGPLGGFSLFFTLEGFTSAGELESALASAYLSGQLTACMRFVSIGEQDLSTVACDVSVPEPSTLTLLGLALGIAGVTLRRRGTLES